MKALSSVVQKPAGCFQMPVLQLPTGIDRFCHLMLAACYFMTASCVSAQNATEWMYQAEWLEPFWRSTVVHGEPILPVRDEATGAATATLLFPVNEILSVRNSAGNVTYLADSDFLTVNGSRSFVVHAGSHIPTKTADELRRPVGSQKYQLTHRDGHGEILFGANLEYHDMQTWVTYRKASDGWPVTMPEFDASQLPITIRKLQAKADVSIVLLGDSISTGCNASGWGGGAPFQPPWQDLLRQHLERQYKSLVTLTNLAVGGTSTPWGLTMIDEIVKAEPDLVLLAFGMNDSAGRSAEEYGQNIAAMIQQIRSQRPATEFILIASMLGNRDWVRLNHDVFPLYRDQLIKQCKPGVTVADMTSVWTEFLRRKQDRDLTGNGVNHPNDFGHRVYAQVLSALLVPATAPETTAPRP
jgi:lysophospholipase L1-like esterase